MVSDRIAKIQSGMLTKRFRCRSKDVSFWSCANESGRVVNLVMGD